MKEELLYKFVQGLTTPEESRIVILWAESTMENRERLINEKELQDVLVWSLPAQIPELSLDDFLKKYTR